MSSDEAGALTFGGFIGILVGGLLGVFVGGCVREDRWREKCQKDLNEERSKAIAAGVAHWELNPKTGETEVVYSRRPKTSE